jgi:ABC-2 type transport system ATP-binding protein
MFEVDGLAKRFAGIEVLHGVSFAVQPGETLGYLGPNGSGKSTTFKIIGGLLEPTAGRLRLNGMDVGDDPATFRQRLEYVPDEPHLYTHLTAPEYLRLVGRLRGLPHAVLEDKIAALLRLLDLAHAAGALMSVFSKGMRQRVLVAAALLHDPDLLVLDEPFSGLDVNASVLLRTLLQALSARGKMILLSSHRMDLVETLCARVLILHHGRIVAEGSPADLRASRLTESLEDVFAMVTEQEDIRPAPRRSSTWRDADEPNAVRHADAAFHRGDSGAAASHRARSGLLSRTLASLVGMLLLAGVFLPSAFFKMGSFSLSRSSFGCRWSRSRRERSRRRRLAGCRRYGSTPSSAGF